MFERLVAKLTGRGAEPAGQEWDVPLRQLAEEFLEEYQRTRDYERARPSSQPVNGYSPWPPSSRSSW